GPTHQPIEQLASLRAIPHLIDLRPADANEVAEAWRVALEPQKYTSGDPGPVALILSRQPLPTFDRSKVAPAAGLRRGAYVLAGGEGEPEIILIGTGSEVQWCLAAHEQLRAEGIRSRVVSMPSWELYEHQPRDYRDSVLPPNCRHRLAIEMASTFGWGQHIGLDPDGAAIGRKDYGASAPLKELLKEFGFTTEHVVAEAKKLLGR
ncbi:MAG TPA: transketolase C-terminal domain-containing protein, partial [Chloroflexota bacterium]